MSAVHRALDAILKRAVAGPPPLPGVVAAVTDARGDIYDGAAGARAVGGAPMTLDTLFQIYSCTKAVTGVAALQCLEEGLIDLDAPAAAYAPDIAQLQVLDGFDHDGRPILRAPKRPITTRMLMLHTAGLAYEFTSAAALRWTRATRHRRNATRAALFMPLVADPGEEWRYGINIEWLGQVVEGVRGKRLGHVARERIFDPLGMEDTAWTPRPEAWERRSFLHFREADGSLRVAQQSRATPASEIDTGGTGLWATVADYMKFIRMWLNDGAAPNGRVLKPETVDFATRNGLERPYDGVGVLEGTDPALSNRVEFFPGLAKGWGYTFLVNEEPAPTGRPAGSLAWAGLGNLYYWIDRRHRIGGFWATQVLPFGDAASAAGFAAFETAVYRSLGA